MKTEDYRGRPAADAVRELGADPARGLTAAEAARRLAEQGPNEIPTHREGLAHRVFRRFWGPIPWMIEAAAALSAAVGKWEDFAIITALLLTNAAIDLWQESKAIDALRVLEEKLARRAAVVRDGALATVPARELVTGDVVRVRIGDVIPADLQLLEGDFVRVDQSALTGESLPVDLRPGDVAYANAVVKQGEMRALVVNTGPRTFFGATVALVARAQREERSHFQKAVIGIGNYLIALTLVLVATILIAALFRQEPLREILRFALILTVAAVPVALPAVLTVTMAVGAMHLARRQAVVSRLVAIEELAGVDVLCTDKTGTLTENRMTVADPRPAAPADERALLVLACVASREEDRDPIELPLFERLRSAGLAGELARYRPVSFRPFDPVAKRTEATVDTDGGRLVVTKGASQVVLALCAEDAGGAAARQVEELAAKGFRTIAVASRPEGQELFRLAGLIPLFDPPREDSRETVEAAQRLGLQVKMVTGDNLAIARQIAGLLGIGPDFLDARELSGAGHRELEILGEVVAAALFRKLAPNAGEDEARRFADGVVEEVREALAGRSLPTGHVRQHESEIVELIERADGFAQVFPEDKYLIVDKLQKAGHIVAMTGDGVNDAPALRKADAGIAVSGATDAARAAADVVLLAPGLSVIIEAIRGARVTFERMRSYSVFRVTETIRIVLFMAASILVFRFYPITAVMIILLAFLNDLPILAIAYDRTKVDPAPVRWAMREVLGLATALGVTGVISSFGAFYLAREVLALPSPVVQSFIFLKLVVAGHSTIYVTRTERRFWQPPYPAPQLLLATTGTELVATALAVSGVFLAPIGWGNALLVWGYALAWFVVNDAVKVVALRRLRHDAPGAAAGG